MFPTIAEIGPFTLRTYGLLVALGFFAALMYVLRMARGRNIKDAFVYDLFFYAILAGIAGARLTYVVTNWPFFAANPADIFKVWEGGLVFYGGFVAGALAVILFVRRRPELRFWALADIVAPALALGHFFGRLGCFFAGCCYGLPSGLPWAVSFTDAECLAPTGIGLHPTQLYEASGNLLLFFGLHRYLASSRREGDVFTAYLFFYGVVRFIVEFFRGDERGGVLLVFSPGQVLSLVLVAAALLMFITRNKRHGTVHHSR